VSGYPPLTRFELDSQRCMAMNCRTPHPHELVLHAVCHPTSPLEVAYFRGVLTFRCARCLDVVAKIAVAGGPLPS
jgi:hypothetical protein